MDGEALYLALWVFTGFIGLLMGLVAALLTLGVLLYCSSIIERLLGRTGLNILSKITGLILAAMAAQIFMGGVMGFLQPIAG